MKKFKKLETHSPSKEVFLLSHCVYRIFRYV